MAQRSFNTQAIIIKRRNLGETDRLVTLLTKKRGKLTCIAKGARRMRSSKRALLEPGTLIQAFLIETKSMPLLTQAKLIAEHNNCRESLPKIRQLNQVLEIIDRLFVEEEESELFDQVIAIIDKLNTGQTAKVSFQLKQIITQLGFQVPEGQSILDSVAEISERPMKSWEYLKL